MYLVYWWNTGFVMGKIAPPLSALRLTCWLSNLYSRAIKNQAIHKASFPTFVIAINSVSFEKRATVSCCFDWWDTDPLEKRKE